MNVELEGRIAFITGGNRGIGRAIAQSLAQEGMHLALFGRDEVELKKTSDNLRRSFPAVRVISVKLDLEQSDSIPVALNGAAAELGGLDVLVNCAGGAYRGKLEDIADDEWERNFRVKPIGLLRMTRAALPYLRRSSQARVINIAGTRGREPSRFSTLAGPINMGTLSATKALANELGPEGITVNAINPGSTDSERWDELVRMTATELKISPDQAIEHLLREVPMGRVVKMQDVADLVVFLASARAGMITGCAINVDGGRSRSI